MVSAVERRALNEEGGVAAARRLRLRVVDRDTLPEGLRLFWSIALLLGLEVNEAS